MDGSEILRWVAERGLLPYVALAAFALMVLFLDAFVPSLRRYLGLYSIVGALVAMATLIVNYLPGSAGLKWVGQRVMGKEPEPDLTVHLLQDPFGQVFFFMFLLAGVLTILLSMGYLERRIV